MSILRITDIDKDLPKLNDALKNLAVAQNDIAFLKLQNKQLLTLVNATTPEPQANFDSNAVFTWTGATLTLSWNNFSLRDTVSGKVVPVAAGSIASLATSTYYWLAWNPVQHTMSHNTVKSVLTNLPNLIIVAQVFTGTGGQSGAAGGGGASPGNIDDAGLRYKNF